MDCTPARPARRSRSSDARYSSSARRDARYSSRSASSPPERKDLFGLVKDDAFAMLQNKATVSLDVQMSKESQPHCTTTLSASNLTMARTLARKEFDAFDTDSDGLLRNGECSTCLEKLCVDVGLQNSCAALVFEDLCSNRSAPFAVNYEEFSTAFLKVVSCQVRTTADFLIGPAPAAVEDERPTLNAEEDMMAAASRQLQEVSSFSALQDWPPGNLLSTPAPHQWQENMAGFLLEPCSTIKLNPNSKTLTNAVQQANCHEGSGWQRLGKALELFFASTLPSGSIVVLTVSSAIGDEPVLKVYAKKGNHAWILMNNGGLRVRMIFPASPPSPQIAPPIEILQNALKIGMEEGVGKLVLQGSFKEHELQQLRLVEKDPCYTQFPALTGDEVMRAAQLCLAASQVGGDILRAAQLCNAASPMPWSNLRSRLNEFISAMSSSCSREMVTNYVERSVLACSTPLQVEEFFRLALHAALQVEEFFRLSQNFGANLPCPDFSFVKHFRNQTVTQMQRLLTNYGVNVFNEIAGEFFSKRQWP